MAERYLLDIAPSRILLSDGLLPLDRAETMVVRIALSDVPRLASIDDPGT